jgi:hypothetical protein
METDDSEFEIEDFDCSINNEFYIYIAPSIKQFLLDYYSDTVYNLESETYLQIDGVIRDACDFADEMISTLYNHKTITDSDEWDKAFDNYRRTEIPFPWTTIDHWFDRTYTNDDDDDFLEEIPESELTDDQKKAKKVVDICDDMLDNHIQFADFMKQGFVVLEKVCHNYLEDYASFDLSILSPEGFVKLEKDIDLIGDIMFDNLFGLLS